MLKARAITQCARDACEEALFGLHYTPEELGAEVDEDGVVVEETPRPPVNGQPAERSGGTPDGDPWYVRPAPEDADSSDTQAEDPPPPWDTDRALKEAASFTNEAAGTELWLAARHAQLEGKSPPANATTSRTSSRPASPTAARKP